MRAKLAVLLAIVGLRAWGAAGDPLSFQVEAPGWFGTLAVSSMSTGGAYALGWGTTNLPSQAKLVLTYQEPGYDGDGVPTWRNVTNYGTIPKRAYVLPAGASDEEASGGVTLLRICFADWIPAAASNITASLASGIYTASAVSTAAATLTSCTNLSAQPMGEVGAHWAWPPLQQIRSNSMPFELVAFHRSAQDYLPVRGAKVFVSDEHGNTASTTITNWTTDNSSPDALNFGRMAGTVDVSGMTQGDALRVDAYVYPWRGDTNSVRDTRRNLDAAPLFASYTNLCDRTLAYGRPYAVVATNGNNSTGQVFTEAQWATNRSPNPFATIAGAAMATAATNNLLYGHNDTGGGTIYLRAGTHAWTGATITGGATNTPKTWVTIAPHPDEPGAQIVNSSGSNDIADATKWDGITLASTASTMNNCAMFWADRCDLTTTGSQTLQATSIKALAYFTRNRFGQFAQSLRYVAPQQWIPALVRGNTFDGAIDQIHTYAVFGNIATTNAPRLSWMWDKAAMTTPVSEGGILYNNKQFGATLLGNNLSGPQSYGIARGWYIVQNSLESTTNNINSTTWDFGGDNATHLTNGFFAHNTTTGRKTFYQYNDTGSAVAWRILMRYVNGYDDDFNNKSFDHSPGDTNRIGAEAVKSGVGFSGYIYGEVAGIGAPGSFLPLWGGLYSFLPPGTQTPSWAGFVDRKSYDGLGTSTAGGGNYNLTTNSPLAVTVRDHVLPYDIDGVSRVGRDSAGAFAAPAGSTNEPPPLPSFHPRVAVRGYAIPRGRIAQ